jgi:hypothetical protein
MTVREIREVFDGTTANSATYHSPQNHAGNGLDGLPACVGNSRHPPAKPRRLAGTSEHSLPRMGAYSFQRRHDAEICWIAFWCIRRTIGRERLFMVGMFTNILLWPAKMLLPQWAFAIRHVGALGLAVATLAALTLLLDASNPANSNRANAAT